MTETPEQKARHDIDAKLLASGWLVQDRDDLDLTAGRGIAVREFPMKSGFGFADYLLYLDRKAVGAIEAKAAGTLTGVEAQSAKYAAGLPDDLPAHRRALVHGPDRRWPGRRQPGSGHDAGAGRGGAGCRALSRRAARSAALGWRDGGD